VNLSYSWLSFLLSAFALVNASFNPAIFGDVSTMVFLKVATSDASAGVNCA